MLNLLRSDLFRLIRGTALWVMTAVLVACMALSAAMLNWVSQPEFLAFYAQTEQMTADEVRDEMRFEETSAAQTTAPSSARVPTACSSQWPARRPRPRTSRR